MEKAREHNDSLYSLRRLSQGIDCMLMRGLVASAEALLCTS